MRLLRNIWYKTKATVNILHTASYMLAPNIYLYSIAISVI